MRTSNPTICTVMLSIQALLAIQVFGQTPRLGSFGLHFNNSAVTNGGAETNCFQWYNISLWNGGPDSWGPLSDDAGNSGAMSIYGRSSAMQTYNSDDGQFPEYLPLMRGAAKEHYGQQIWRMTNLVSMGYLKYDIYLYGNNGSATLNGADAKTSTGPGGTEYGNGTNYVKWSNVTGDGFRLDINECDQRALQVVQVPVPPTLDNEPGPAMSDDGTSAMLNGRLLVAGCLPPAFVRVYYGTNDGGTNASSWATNWFFGKNTNVCPYSYSNQITGLPANQYMYYRYYGITTNGLEGWAPSTTNLFNGFVTIAATGTNASETGPTNAVFTVYRPIEATNDAIRVNYSVGGTAVGGVDYKIPQGFVIIPKGSTNADFAITPVDDNLMRQTNQTITVSLIPGGYRIGLASNATVSIAENDFDDLTTWNYRMKIDFPGYAMSETLTNFPALVGFNTNLTNFAYSKFASPANAGDLRFFNSNGTIRLNHEVEQWNTNGNSYVWVQVPSFTSNCHIWAYWGNTNETAPPAYTTNGSTWTTNFVAVWHMAQTNAQDSTADRHNGTANGGVSLADGAIGLADRFNRASGGYISVPSSQAFQQTGNFTLSAWVYDNGTYSASERAIIGDYNSPGFMWRLQNNRMGFWDEDWGQNSGQVLAGGWHLVVVTKKGTGSGSGVYFSDGSVSGAAFDGGSGIVGYGNLEIGDGGPGWDGRWDGLIDEIRIENVSRSSNWLYACWQNQRAGSTFGSYSKVAHTRMPEVDNSGGATNVTLTSAYLNGSLWSTGTAPAEVVVYWGTTDAGTNASAWGRTNSFGTNFTAPPVSYSHYVSPLAPDTVYYYRYSSANIHGTNWAGASTPFATAGITVQAVDSNACKTTGESGAFRIFRPAAASAFPLTVNYTLGGTATNGIHYGALPGSVTIPMGAESADVYVMPSDDLRTDGERTVVISLATGSYIVGTPSNATVLISDSMRDWQYRMKISFTGYTRGETLTNFPALVVFNTNLTNFAYGRFSCPSNAADLRFLDSDEAGRLIYEIDNWDTNGCSYAWVRVPRFSQGCFIWAYWGNTNVTAPPVYSTNGSTWNTNFMGVWHLNQTNATDSTSRGHTGSAQNGPTNTTGLIGRALNFVQAGSQYIDVPQSDDFSLTSSGWTLSAWVYQPVVSEGGIFGTYSGGYIFAAGNGGNYLSLHNRAWYGTTPMSMSGWKYVTVSQGADTRFYVNGQPGQTLGGSYTVNCTKNLEIGSGGPDWTHFNGSIDEVRTENIGRSSNWVWACWLNQGSNDLFNSYGQALHRQKPEVDNSGGATNVSFTSAWLNGTLISTGYAPAEVWVFWGTNNGGTDTASWSGSNCFGVNAGQPPVSYSYCAEGLAPNSSYYYRYCGINSYGTNWAAAPAVFITGSLTIQATDPDANEEGADPGMFTIYRPAALTNEPTIVNYTISGAASNGVDYTWLPGSVTIPAGMTNANILLATVDDQLIDQGPHQAVLSLAPGAYVTGDPGSAAVLIQDNDVLLNWSYKMKISFNYNRSDTLTGFPALVIFSPGMKNFSYTTFASATGGDLRFADSSETQFLNHEIDLWNNTGSSFAWVQVPEFKSNCCVWAYWGNANAVIQPAFTTNGSTWNSGFVGVWHMSDVNAADSTRAQHNGVASGTVSPATGIIGSADSFSHSGSSGYISVPASSAFEQPGDFTISAWVNDSGTDADEHDIIGNYNSQGGWFGINGNTLGFWSENWAGGPQVPDLEWHHVVVQKSASMLYYYLDGSVFGTTFGGGDGLTGYSRNLTLGAGGQDRVGNEAWDGILDEIRFESVARSSNWLWASWISQASNDVSCVYGPARYMGCSFIIR